MSFTRIKDLDLEILSKMDDRESWEEYVRLTNISPICVRTICFGKIER